MRELKFRAYIEENGRKRFEFIDLNGTNADELARFHALTNKFGVIKEQFTGLKDKNGKEIYEGDIVSEEFAYRDENVKTIWQVRWCDYEGAFELHYVSGFELDDSSLDADEEDYDVIGNIHENPELINKEDA